MKQEHCTFIWRTAFTASLTGVGVISWWALGAVWSLSLLLHDLPRDMAAITQSLSANSAEVASIKSEVVDVKREIAAIRSRVTVLEGRITRSPPGPTPMDTPRSDGPEVLPWERSKR